MRRLKRNLFKLNPIEVKKRREMFRVYPQKGYLCLEGREGYLYRAHT